jgi:dihydrodipicolinate synthase/N-acetylneuraminate lyase
VSWFNTQGVIERLKIAVDVGIANVHVALPLFMPLAQGDVDRYFEDLATAVPAARWIHYAHPASQPTLTGSDYARLADRFADQFTGTKIAAANSVGLLTEILTQAPMLAHQVGGMTLVVGAMLGACGNCSFWANVLPRWSRRYMDACDAGRWDEAIGYHKKLVLWEMQHIAPLLRAGYRHGIISQARNRLSGVLFEGAATRAPYCPVTPEIMPALQKAFDQAWAKELAAENVDNA